MKQHKMKRKGMTLFEIIISIAIYAVLAALLTEIMTLINATMRSTREMNTRLAYEAKFADNLQDMPGFDHDDCNLFISYGGTNGDHVLGETPGGGTPSGTHVVQYTVQYNPEAGIGGFNFHDGTNYKFMMFDKVGQVQREKPGPTFKIELQLKPNHQADKITRIKVLEVTDENTSQVITELKSDSEITPPAGGKFDAEKGQSIDIMVSNDAPVVEDALNTATKDWSGKIKIEVYTIDPNQNAEVLTASAVVEFYTAIKISNWVNYYPGCVVTYEQDTRKFAILAS